MKRFAWLLCCLLHATAGTSKDFDPGYGSAVLEIEGLTVPYALFSWFAMPNQVVTLAATDPGGSELTLAAEQGKLEKSAAGWKWRGKVPGGPYPLRVLHAGQEVLRVNLFVLTPSEELKDGRIGNYRIGSYPAAPPDKGKNYHRPTGFVKLTEDNRDTPVSPHFTLGQFDSKQDDPWPHYLLLRPRLLLKLELILEMLNRGGIRTDGLHIMSGYRTPFYNDSIGNVPYSRHLWGGAADIFVDVRPVDGRMDDLNGDGRSDIDDAAFLAQIIDDRFRAPGVEHLVGGLSQYRANRVHGPFVHIDVRGYRARW